MGYTEDSINQYRRQQAILKGNTGTPAPVDPPAAPQTTSQPRAVENPVNSDSTLVVNNPADMQFDQATGKSFNSKTGQLSNVGPEGGIAAPNSGAAEYGGAAVAGAVALGSMAANQNKDYGWEDYAIQGVTTAVDSYYFGGIPVTSTLSTAAGLGSSGGETKANKEQEARTDMYKAKTDVLKETKKSMQMRRAIYTAPYDAVSGILGKIKS